MENETIGVICTCGNLISAKELNFVNGTSHNGIPMFYFAIDCNICGKFLESYGPGAKQETLEEACIFANNVIKDTK
jgi:hypothetical protein